MGEKVKNKTTLKKKKKYGQLCAILRKNKIQDRETLLEEVQGK